MGTLAEICYKFSLERVGTGCFLAGRNWMGNFRNVKQIFIPGYLCQCSAGVAGSCSIIWNYCHPMSSTDTKN